MKNIIKQMLKIIGDFEGSKLTINFWPPDEFYIYVYESEIPICIDIKEKCAYVDTETCNHHITASMLDELSRIVKLLDDNIDIILDCLNDNEKQEDEKDINLDRFYSKLINYGSDANFCTGITCSNCKIGSEICEKLQAIGNELKNKNK